MNNWNPIGVANDTYGSDIGGGTVSLTNSSITTAQSQSTGVYTSNNGSTTLKGGSITINGAILMVCSGPELRPPHSTA